MAIYRTVKVSFWTDSKIIDDFTPEDRYFYLYLMTNPHTNLCGCYEVSIKQMADETGYTKETIEKLIKRLETIHKVIAFSPDTKEILLTNWSKYNWTSSTKYRKPLFREIEVVKNDRFRHFLRELYNGNDTVSIPYLYRSDTTISSSNTISNTISNTNSNSNSNSNSITEIETELDIVPELENELEPEIDHFDVKCAAIGGFYSELFLRGDRIKRITDTQRKLIRESMRYYTLDDFKTVFSKAEASPFLRGDKTDFKASFNWLIKADNMEKVLAGTYDEQEKKLKPTGAEEMDDFYSMINEWVEEKEAERGKQGNGT